MKLLGSGYQHVDRWHPPSLDIVQVHPVAETSQIKLPEATKLTQDIDRFPTRNPEHQSS
jgi:hypothetical protein